MCQCPLLSNIASPNPKPLLARLFFLVSPSPVRATVNPPIKARDLSLGTASSGHLELGRIAEPNLHVG